MLEPNRPNPSSRLRPPFSRAAKWPPDDDDGPPTGGGGTGLPSGGGGGGSFDSGDGNFKKGATKPIAIFVGLLAVGGLAAFLLLGVKQEQTTIPVEKAAQIKKELLVLPTAEQLPRWREYATSNSSYLKQESLKHLAWAQDPGRSRSCDRSSRRRGPERACSGRDGAHGVRLSGGGFGEARAPEGARGIEAGIEAADHVGPRRTRRKVRRKGRAG